MPLVERRRSRRDLAVHSVLSAGDISARGGAYTRAVDTECRTTTAVDATNLVYVDTVATSFVTTLAVETFTYVARVLARFHASKQTKLVFLLDS